MRRFSKVAKRFLPFCGSPGERCIIARLSLSTPKYRKHKANLRRATAAEARRLHVCRLFARADLSQRGWQTRIAEQLGVHRSTVCRDIQRIIADGNQWVRSPENDPEQEHRHRFIRMIDQARLRQELLASRDSIYRGIANGSASVSDGALTA